MTACLRTTFGFVPFDKECICIEQCIDLGIIWVVEMKLNESPIAPRHLKLNVIEFQISSKSRKVTFELFIMSYV